MDGSKVAPTAWIARRSRDQLRNRLAVPIQRLVTRRQRPHATPNCDRHDRSLLFVPVNAICTMRRYRTSWRARFAMADFAWFTHCHHGRSTLIASRRKSTNQPAMASNGRFHQRVHRFSQPSRIVGRSFSGCERNPGECRQVRPAAPSTRNGQHHSELIRP